MSEVQQLQRCYAMYEMKMTKLLGTARTEVRNATTYDQCFDAIGQYADEATMVTNEWLKELKGIGKSPNVPATH